MPKPSPLSPDIQLVTTTAGAAAAVFVFDLFFPQGVAIGMLYAIPVLLAARSRQPRFTLLFAAACTILAVLGHIYSASGAPLWIAITNRALSIIVFWGVALLSLQHLKVKEQVDLLHDLLPMCASCHKIRDDKGYWSKVEEYLEARTQTMLTHGICPECMQKWYPEFYPQVVEQYPDLFKDASAGIADERRLHPEKTP